LNLKNWAFFAPQSRPFAEQSCDLHIVLIDKGVFQQRYRQWSYQLISLVKMMKEPMKDILENVLQVESTLKKQ